MAVIPRKIGEGGKFIFGALGILVRVGGILKKAGDLADILIGLEADLTAMRTTLASTVAMANDVKAKHNATDTAVNSGASQVVLSDVSAPAALGTEVEDAPA